MQIRFILRSPGTGYSLENLFNRVIDSFVAGPTVQPQKIVLPYISSGLRALWRNSRSVGQHPQGLTHITGDVHYIALVTDPRRTVLTIPDCVLLDRTPTWSVRYVVFWLLWYYLPIRRAAIVTAISEKTRQELLRYVGRAAQKVVTVPCQYDPAFTYRPKTFNTACPTLLHVGTAPHKNLRRLIDALTGMSCQLLIVGKLPEADRQALITAKVRYENYVDCTQEGILSLYDRCDLVAFVSLYEGFGLPVLEGQATGRPVLTSNRRPMTDVGGAGACYVDPLDTADIRRGVQQICQDETYRTQLIAEGLRNVQAYTLERVTAQYTTLYQSLPA